MDRFWERKMEPLERLFMRNREDAETWLRLLLPAQRKPTVDKKRCCPCAATATVRFIKARLRAPLSTDLKANIFPVIFAKNTQKYLEEQ